jgi:hypothetical protein
MLSNSKLATITENEKIIIPTREEVESNENGVFETKETPVNNFYVYKLETGEKVNYTKIENKKYQINDIYTNLILDYDYEYTKGGSLITVG